MSPVSQIRGFWSSVCNAVLGLAFAARSQRNIRIHTFAAAVALAAGLALRLSRVEYLLLILTVVMVLVAELFNSSVEFVLNLLEIHHHPVVRTAKDLAAAATLLAVAGSIVVGVLLFGPRLCGSVGR